jgi:type II secretory ATPase GspE/PulE/Tfp pilus assembly ATPase PilB-like protein
VLNVANLANTTGLLTLGEGLILMSFWKPILILIPLVPWAWLVSKVLDKHAARFFLARNTWNMVHLIVGLVGVIACISMPMKTEAAFWVGWGIMIVLLAADVAVFAMVTNKDERVPAEFRLRISLDSIRAAQAKRDVAKKQGAVELILKGPDKGVVPPPIAETPEFAARVAAEALFIRSMAARASQIDIAPVGKDNLYSASFLVDGLRMPPEPLPGADAVKIMDFWKSVAKLDLADRRKKLVGDIAVEKGDSRKKVRVTSIGAQAGMRLSMLMDPEAQVKRKSGDLGLLEPQMVELKKLIDDPHGVVLLTSPLDNGRTTTMYTIVKMHDAYTKNVQTIEIDMQDALEGIRQNKFDPQADGAEFSTLVRSILRRDPDVVGVAELQDVNTAKEIARADQERTRTYVSMKADSALEGIRVWMKAAGDADVASKCLRGTLGQKLLRKLCMNCRVAYQPSADMVKKLGLPPDRIKQLFKKGGQVLIKNKPEVCPVCGGVGYIGQEGVFEIFPLGETERALIKNGDWNALKVEFRKRGFPTVQQTALRKAIDGVTSVEEVMRITGDGAPPAAAAKPPTTAGAASAAAPTPPTAQAPKPPAPAGKA